MTIRRPAIAFVVALGIGASACGGSSPSDDATPPTTPTTATPALAPLCDNRPPPSWVAEATHPLDDVVDPAGRVFFASFLRENDIVAQIVGPLFAIDPDGSDLAQVLDCQIARPRVSPDGKRLALSVLMDDTTWQVATVAIDGTDLQVVTSGKGFSETPDWSPDGASLVYSYLPCPSEEWERCITAEGEGWAIWRMDADGSNPSMITPPGSLDWEPRWSPDGESVVFARLDLDDGPGARYSIVVRNLATGVERTLTHPTLTLEHPDWSPDGRWIIYNTLGERGCADCERVERVPADDLTVQPEVLSEIGVPSFKPAYAPDGSGIVYGCAGDVCLMGPNGEDPRVLIGHDSELNHFDWGPAR